jgi:pilus assembly protein Flp/PilA
MPKLFRNRRGQGLIEYLIIVSIMAVGSLLVMRSLNQTVKARFAAVANALAGHSNQAKAQAVDPSAYRRSDMGNFFKGALDSDAGQDAND